MFSSFSRRKLLSIIGFLITGTVVAGSFPFVDKLFTTKVQAQEAEEGVYKDRKYRIVTIKNHQETDTVFDTSERLFIDNREIKIARNKETKKYLTPLLFGQFNSPREVAIMLIDLGIQLPSGEVKLDPNVD